MMKVLYTQNAWCPACGKEHRVQIVEEEVTENVDGLTVRYKQIWTHCPDADPADDYADWYDEGQIDETTRRYANAYNLARNALEAHT